jgi:hypothetical protein
MAQDGDPAIPHRAWRIEAVAARAAYSALVTEGVAGCMQHAALMPHEPVQVTERYDDDVL